MDPEKDMFDIPTELEVPEQPQEEVVEEVQVESNVDEISKPIDESPVIDVNSNEQVVDTSVSVDLPSTEVSVNPIVGDVEAPLDTALEISEPPVIEEGTQTIESAPVVEEVPSNTVETQVEEPVVQETTVEAPVEENTSVSEVPVGVGVDNSTTVIEPSVPVSEPIVEPPISDVNNVVLLAVENMPTEEDKQFETSVMNIVNNVSENQTEDYVSTPIETPIPEQPQEVIQNVEMTPIVNTPSESPQEVVVQQSVATEVSSIPIDNTQVIQTNLDTNPPDALIESKVKPEEPKKKFNFLPIILIVVAVLAVASIIIFVVPMFKSTKPVKEETSNLKAVKLEYKTSLEEAYNIKDINLSSIIFDGDDLYEVENGVVNVYYGENTKYVIQMQEEEIKEFGFVFNNNKYIFVFKDLNNNLYIKSIDKIKGDITLTLDDSSMLFVSAEKEINYISAGEYPDGRGVFYLAEKNNKKYYIDLDEEGNAKLSELTDKLYEGQDISISSLKFNNPSSDKLKVSGVGISYEDVVYLYTGDYSEITNYPLKDSEDNPYLCNELYLVYDPDYEYVTLYIFYQKEEKTYLYEVDLLKSLINETEITESLYDSPVKEKEIKDGKVNIVFENNQVIEKK